MTVRAVTVIVCVGTLLACRRPPGRASDARDVRGSAQIQDAGRDVHMSEPASIDASAVTGIDVQVRDVVLERDAQDDVQRARWVDVSFPDTGPVMACRSDDDCTIGRKRGVCYTAGLDAQYTQAFATCDEGHAWKAVHTVGTCIFHECNDNVDNCPEGMRCGTLDMVPFPQRVCVRSACRYDSDCRRASGGRCASYLAAGRCQRGGFACSYPSDACGPRDPQRMCPYHDGMITFCAPNGANGRFVCVDEPAVQP